ncbi:HutI Imidazolonepropionase and related amidohydrolases [Rhabdaerophilaceae bacterium]
MSLLHFKNFEMLDPEIGDVLGGYEILVEGDQIREVSAKPLKPKKASVIDCGKRTLMPGLIDSHVHVCASTVNLGAMMSMPDALVAFRTAKIMKGMLDRGFTTVRDVGGGSYALVEAMDEGLFEGPRLFTSGKALSQTGGHSDARSRYDNSDPTSWARHLGRLGRLCDGVPEVRKAAREELKQGAHFIKIMANGGVASPNDPIHFLGFSREEIIAVVEEAQNAGTYVAAHLYTDEAIARAVECGVHSLEHCNLIKEKTAKVARKAGAIACPTLVTYEYLKIEGAAMGLPAVSVAKIDTVGLSGLQSLEIMTKAGLPMAFGTDLLGEMHKYQSEEFVIRGRALPAVDIVRSATLVGAQLLRMEGKLGCLKPGAFADLILIDGNPLRDLALFTGQGQHMPMIMKGGRMIKNRLQS